MKKLPWTSAATCTLWLVVGVTVGLSIPCEVQKKQSPEPPLVGGPFRPRPRPNPEPAPPPLAEGDRLLFDRLRPHFLPLMREHAAAEVAAEIQAAIDAMDTAKIDDVPVVVVGEPSQGVLGSLLASKLIGFIKKWTTLVVMGMVGTALIALAYKFWWIIVPVFMGAVSLVAWPAGWAAAKFAQPKKE